MVAAHLSYHVRILGVLWVIYGILRIVGALWLIAFNPKATLMFGALLSRVPDPFTMMSEFHLLYLVIVVWCFVCGVVGIIAGLALFARARAARWLAILAAFLSIPEIPFGIALGSYTLVILLPYSASQLYRGLRGESRAARA